MIGRSQIAILHVARKQLGMDDDAWRALLAPAAFVTSSTKLGQGGFNLVMLELERLGFKSRSARRNYGNRPGMATDAQVAKIRVLWREWSGTKG
ncbi:MAG: phage protein GemA/Gp16 family protein, partial [Geminicoccales bacterium]